MKIIGKYFLRIFTFLILVSVILFLYIDNLISFFLTNKTLNAIILFVIAAGIIYIIRQLLIIINELSWLNQLLKANKTTTAGPANKIAPIDNNCPTTVQFI